MDRRASLRIQRQLDCVVYIDHEELNATILDISENGISFLVDPQVNLTVGLPVAITLCDEYVDKSESNVLYAENIFGVISEISLKDNKWRCGCRIDDPYYTEYVREQLIKQVCSAFQSA